MINIFIHNLCIASLCTTIFSLVFILLRQLIIESIGARWNYCLWFVIFIPWIAVWLPLNFSSDHFHGMTIPLDFQYNLQHLAPFVSDISLPYMMFILWLAGMIFYSISILFRHFRFIFFLKESAHALTTDQKNRINKVLINKSWIPLQRIYLSTEIASPFICHIFKSKIYLPINFFDDYTSDEQKYVLQHECVHYHRCDLIANTIMLILICLNWFNPVILFSYRYFRSAQELSCDAILSQQYSSDEKKSYGYALLKASIGGIYQGSFMSCWWNSGAQLKERCIMLKFHNSNPVKNFIGFITLSIITSIAIAAPNLEKCNSGMKISNLSRNPLTFSTGNGCSEEIGMIEAHNVKTISRNHLIEACQKDLTHCQMFVYSTSNCSGKPIIRLDVDVTGWGVMSIQPTFSNSYHVSANGFNLFFDGPWI